MRPGTAAYPYPGKSTSVALVGVSNKLMSCVRPGVFETLASCLRCASALISADLPTFDRPTKATSTGDGGKSATSVAD